jgi:AmmeMemoRadiSam system protein B
MHQVRPAAVAGTFYPGQAQALSRTVQELLGPFSPAPQAVAGPPKALIVPHAGYVYSGATAAQAYAQLTPWRQAIGRVVLLGPVHRVPVRGLALPGVDALATPLGEVDIDPVAIEALRRLPQVVISAAAHAQEHSLEVQLPFLQTVLEAFTLVPLAVGDATPDEVSQVLESVWGGPETLIVISSDLSHFLSHGQATAVDRQSVQTLLALQPTLDHRQACGATPINGLLLAARRHHLRPQLLALCNSGDTAGDRQRVVGYAAVAFFEGAVAAMKPQVTEVASDTGDVLLALARNAIGSALGVETSPVNTRQSAWLKTPAACFVTLTQNGRLRGCIDRQSVDPADVASRPASRDLPAAGVGPAFCPDEPREFDALQLQAQGRARCGTNRQLSGTAQAQGRADVKPPVALHRAQWESVRPAGAGHEQAADWMPNPLSRAMVAHAGRRPHPVRPVPARLPLHEGQRGACFVRMRERRRHGADHLRALVGLLRRPDREEAAEPVLPRLQRAVVRHRRLQPRLQVLPELGHQQVARHGPADGPGVARRDRARRPPRLGCRSVAFTYNDPVIFAEYAMDVADACHALGIKTVAVTAGYIHDQARREFFAKMDAANVDLKAFTEDFYFKLTGSHLQPVLDTLVYLKHETQGVAGDHDAADPGPQRLGRRDHLR